MVHPIIQTLKKYLPKAYLAYFTRFLIVSGSKHHQALLFMLPSVLCICDALDVWQAKSRAFAIGIALPCYFE
jgi:hypothetical protein